MGGVFPQVARDDDVVDVKSVAFATVSTLALKMEEARRQLEAGAYTPPHFSST